MIIDTVKPLSERHFTVKRRPFDREVYFLVDRRFHSTKRAHYDGKKKRLNFIGGVFLTWSLDE